MPECSKRTGKVFCCQVEGKEWEGDIGKESHERMIFSRMFTVEMTS